MFTRPAGAHLLWRERPFDAAQPDGIAQGVMDRVVVHLGPDGAPVRAEILDFKTDRITPDRLDAQTAHHRPQMTLYRHSLARLLGIADTAVKVELLFTAIPAVADVFANFRSILHKGDGNQHVAAPPDVCQTPSPAVSTMRR